MEKTTRRILRVHSLSCNSGCRPAPRRARGCLGCCTPLPRSAPPWHAHCWRCWEWSLLRAAVLRFTRSRA
jgi:hypothetical protein